MEDEKSDVIDPDEGAALVTIKEGTIQGAQAKAESEHLRIQAEQEGRQLNAEENEAERKDLQQGQIQEEMDFFNLGRG